MALTTNNIEKCTFYNEPILKNKTTVVCDSALPTSMRKGARCARTSANAIQTCVYCPAHTVRRPIQEEKPLLKIVK